MELREAIAEIVKDRMFAADVRSGQHYTVADAILALPEIRGALEHREDWLRKIRESDERGAAMGR